MPEKPTSHPTLSTARQFRAADADAMQACFSNHDAMRFWNQPAHTKRIETERAARNFIDCTRSCYRFWAVADAATDRRLGLVDRAPRCSEWLALGTYRNGADFLCATPVVASAAELSVAPGRNGCKSPADAHAAMDGFVASHRGNAKRFPASQ